MNLANIIMGLEEDSEIVKALEGLKDLNLESGAEGTLIKNCQTLEVECAKGMAEKVVCTKHDPPDPQLTQCSGAHDARLDRHKELAVPEDR